jgi:hypothetical protein
VQFTKDSQQLARNTLTQRTKSNMSQKLAISSLQQKTSGGRLTHAYLKLASKQLAIQDNVQQFPTACHKQLAETDIRGAIN